MSLTMGTKRAHAQGKLLKTEGIMPNSTLKCQFSVWFHLTYPHLSRRNPAKNWKLCMTARMDTVDFISQTNNVPETLTGQGEWVEGGHANAQEINQQLRMEKEKCTGLSLLQSTSLHCASGLSPNKRPPMQRVSGKLKTKIPSGGGPPSVAIIQSLAFLHLLRDQVWAETFCKNGRKEKNKKKETERRTDEKTGKRIYRTRRTHQCPRTPMH